MTNQTSNPAGDLVYALLSRSAKSWELLHVQKYLDAALAQGRKEMQEPMECGHPAVNICERVSGVAWIQQPVLPLGFQYLTRTDEWVKCLACSGEAKARRKALEEVEEIARNNEPSEVSYPIEWHEKMTGEEEDAFNELARHLYKQAGDWIADRVHRLLDKESK